MEIPSVLFLEDEDGSLVEMEVIGVATAQVAGEERTYLALFPADSLDLDDSAATLVRFVDEEQGIAAIEDDDEFEAALAALDMESAEGPAEIEETEEISD